MRGRSEKDDVETLRLIYVIERAIKAEGLPAHGGLVLAYIAGQPDGSALLWDVREACSLGPTQSSRVAESLEEAGLVKRGAGQDGRFTTVRLTTKGRGVVEQIIRAAQSGE
jgi:DNA-binding MarR family transcriptional regulator